MNEDPIDRLLRETSLEKLVLAALALLSILVAAGYLYGVKPSWQALADIQGQRVQAESGTEGEQGLSPRIQELEAQVQALREAFQGDAEAIPRSQIESHIVGALDRLSGKHAVSLRSVQPDEASELWMFEELPYTVEVQGSYRALHRWMYEVERELRPMVIKQFSIQPDREDEQVSMRMRIVAYRAGEEVAS